jgi:hypothetical protein
MAGTLKKVRFKVAWGNYRVGDEITPNGTLRDLLVGQGYVDIIEDAPLTVQTPVNRMTRPTHARKRA